MGRKPNTTENFWANVDIRSNDECWPWKGALHRDGYGKVGWSGRTVQAHRVAYELTYGPIPKVANPHDAVIRHKCDNRPCCNPRHLLIGTEADNCRDKMERGRHKFISNPPKGESSPKAKLQTADVLLIRELFATGQYSQKALGRQFGVTDHAIRRIVKRKCWKHI